MIARLVGNVGQVNIVWEPLKWSESVYILQLLTKVHKKITPARN